MRSRCASASTPLATTTGGSRGIGFHIARTLHAAVEIGDEIPAEHFKAVAEIIGYVLRLKGKLPGPAIRPAGTR